MTKTTLAALLLIALASLPVRGIAHSQNKEGPLTAVSFEKLKIRTLDERSTMIVPPSAIRALGLPEIRMEGKQLAVAVGTEKHFFILRLGAFDDVFISVQDAKGNIRTYLTNSELKLRAAASSTKTEPLRALVPEKAVTGFKRRYRCGLRRRRQSSS